MTDEQLKDKLVATAMLAALKAINSRLTELSQSGRKPHTNDLNDFKRWSGEAIAKAEGRK